MLEAALLTSLIVINEPCKSYRILSSLNKNLTLIITIFVERSLHNVWQSDPERWFSNKRFSKSRLLMKNKWEDTRITLRELYFCDYEFKLTFFRSLMSSGKLNANQSIPRRSLLSISIKTPIRQKGRSLRPFTLKHFRFPSSQRGFLPRESWKSFVTSVQHATHAVETLNLRAPRIGLCYTANRPRNTTGIPANRPCRSPGGNFWRASRFCRGSRQPDCDRFWRILAKISIWGGDSFVCRNNGCGLSFDEIGDLPKGR